MSRSHAHTQFEDANLVQDSYPTAIVNYVWISKTPDPAVQSEDQPKCSVPLHYLDKAYENARHYPEAYIGIWLDKKLLNTSSLEWIERHRAQHDLPNVEICDLNDIPGYDVQKSISDFDQMDIWRRVDFARVVVIEHCLENAEVNDVFYSDFDVEDIGLRQDDIHDRLENYGVILGATTAKKFFIENGYMGFRRSTGGVLKAQQLLCETDKAMELTSEESGFLILRDCAEIWAAQHGVKPEELSVKIQPPSGDVLAPNPYYTDLGIN